MKKRSLVQQLMLMGIALGLAFVFSSCSKDIPQSPKTKSVTGTDGSRMQEGSNLVSHPGTQGSQLVSAPIASSSLPGGQYFIQPNAYRYLALDVPNGSTQDGIGIQQYFFSYSSSNQWWNVIRLTNGYYLIENLRTRKYLDVPNGSLAPGVRIQQHTYNGELNQQWRIETFPTTGISRIYNRLSGLALDVPDASRASGTFIQQFTPHNGSNQAWYFKLFDPKALF
jgi:hypothetical protein